MAGRSIRHPPDLLQLLDQVHLGVEAAGGVGEDEVVAPGVGPLHGVEDHGTGIAPLGAAHDLDAGALRPLVELLGGGGPEGVARGQSTERPAAFWRRATLPMVVVFPTPFTPTKSHTHVPSPPKRELGAAGGVERSPQVLAQRRDDRVGAAQLTVVHPGAQVLEQGGGRGHADVGTQQGLFEVVPRLVVDR